MLTVHRILQSLITAALVATTAHAQAPATPENLPTPQARTIFEQPRDGLPILLRTRETYEKCATYRAQGAVRVVVYEEQKKSQSFLFQEGGGSTRTKRYKLFSTAFKRDPFSLRQEILSISAGRSFTSIDYWSPQRHAVDHYSSSPLPMTTQALANAIRENNYLLLNYDPAPEWLLASNPDIAPALEDKADWLMQSANFPRDVWWIGEETLAGVPTDILTWRTSMGDGVAVWLTREPLAIVKVMAERADERDYTNITVLMQPEFGVAVSDDELALNRPRPDFFSMDPSNVVFGSLEMPPVPAERTPMAPSNSDDITATPRSTETPNPPAIAEIEEAPASGVAGANVEMAQLPGEQIQDEVEAEQAPERSILTPEQLAAIVVIEGDQGVGTGFFCKIRGRDFIVTNQHVLTGHRQLRIRTVDGTPVKAGEIYGAIGHDIAMIAVEEPHASLIAAESVDESTNIGDPVVVPGNKLGGGVVTQVTGEVLGIGPDRVEIDAKFVPGNSGSPIINLDTGEVIAVATYVKKDKPSNFAEEEAFRNEVSRDGSIVRWFGYRIDSVTQWEQINWFKWQRQHDLVTKFSDDSLALYQYLNNNNAFYNNRELRSIYDDYLEAMADRKQTTDYYERQTRLFVQHMINFARRDLEDVNKTKFYDYFESTANPKDNIKENVKYREMLIEYLSELRDNNWRKLYNRVRNRTN
ncbi:S1 family peptidase [Cerasicoccus fimbriatus]|uniref:S1 family peptidase n=1 Tax=Cerasicoccus fimbriatus TaxID=3014554 RepID=UPI0022B41763|nr:serine protease [Cerasicoccus sp. TK19100]